MNARRYFDGATVRGTSVLVLVAIFGMSLAACHKQGPFEKAGEEVDEAVDTIKQGKESTANKLDDAADDVRDGFEKARDDLKDK